MKLNEFEKMSVTERLSIPPARRDVTFIAKRSTLGFENLEERLSPQVKVDGSFTVPPSPVIMSKENVAQVFVITGDDWKGKWLRFFFLTYFYEGFISYTKVDEDTFK